RRLDEAQNEPPERALPAPALADEPHRLAAADFDRHAVDRAEQLRRAPEEPLLHREVLRELLGAEERSRPLFGGGVRGLLGCRLRHVNPRSPGSIATAAPLPRRRAPAPRACIRRSRAGTGLRSGSRAAGCGDRAPFL